MIRIYLTNLARYNAGTLSGKWIELPQDSAELAKEILTVLNGDEEYFITDYEADFDIEEYENPFELNEFAEQLELLGEYDLEKVLYYLENVDNDRSRALENYEDVEFYQGMTLQDVAEELIEEGVFGDINDSVKSYIDYDKLARDLMIDGYHETPKGTFRYL